MDILASELYGTKFAKIMMFTCTSCHVVYLYGQIGILVSVVELDTRR